MAYTESWIEAEPDGSVIPVSQLDNWIRKTKVAIRERLEDTALNKGLIENGTWSTGPVPKLGSARTYVVIEADIGTLPLQDGRLAVTSDTNKVFHLKGTGAVVVSGGGAGAFVPTAGGTMTGKLIVGIGALSTATSTENPESVQTWVTQEANEKAMVLSGPSASISLYSNTNGANTQPPSGKIRYAYIGGQADHGVRMGQNLQYFPSGTSPKLFDPTLPRGNFGFDHDGTLSLTWDPAAIAGATYDWRVGGTRSNAPYVPFSGQSLVIYAQGFLEGSGPLDYGHVDIMTMRAGQTLRLGTSNIANDPRHAIEITAHIASGAGNVNIKRQAVCGGVAGIPCVRMMNVGAVAGAADGSMWWDGSEFQCQKGGTVRNILTT